MFVLVTHVTLHLPVTTIPVHTEFGHKTPNVTLATLVTLLTLECEKIYYIYYRLYQNRCYKCNCCYTYLVTGVTEKIERFIKI